MSRNREARRVNHRQVAQALGWFSIGLGLAQILAPRHLARAIGVKEHPVLFRMLGLREIASGLGILSQTKPTTWQMSRVAGDAMDLALLGTALARTRSARSKVATAAAAVAGVTALDVYCSQKLRQQGNGHGGAVHVTKTITVNRSPEELYQFWRFLNRLPDFMSHLKSVEVIDEKRSHWVAKGPAGTTVEWDAEIINETPNQLIAWRSIKGSTVENAGSVRFEKAPGGRGTIVKVELQYTPPAGVIGAKVAKLFGEAPEQQIAVDLRRFKQLMETGEITKTEGQPAGRSRSTSRKFDDLVRS